MNDATGADRYWPLLERLAGTESMRAMDAHAIETLGIPARQLMENAAMALADRVASEWIRCAGAGDVVVCCGSGNNGGDGFAAARLLKRRGVPTRVVQLGSPHSAEAKANRDAWVGLGETVDAVSDAGLAAEALGQAGVVVDALFGTGLSRPIEGPAGELIDRINSASHNAPRPVVAADIPSGVNGDTGQVLGRAVRCTHTVAFQVGKPGCYQHPGASHAGSVEIVDIGIPLYWPEGDAPTYRLTEDAMAALLPVRAPDGHKGTFGHLLAVGGSAGMGGAALLAGWAAQKIGAGLVTAGVPATLQDGFLGAAPELMTLSAEGGSALHFDASHVQAYLSAAESRSAVVLGCGLGRSDDTQPFVRKLVSAVTRPLLIDADGLYHLEPEHLRNRGGATVITPHPGELARLADIGAAEIAADRLSTARRLAAEWNVVLLLKGAATVIAEPRGAAFINPTGDNGLASGGSGDVLSGIVGGLLAQGLAPLQATLLGAYVHGLARDCRREELSAAYFTATDLIAGLNAALQRLERRAGRRADA